MCFKNNFPCPKNLLTLEYDNVPPYNWVLGTSLAISSQRSPIKFSVL